LPNDLTNIGKHLTLTPVMLANVASWSDGGYFTTIGNYFPLKHYWSLAVEEQFYVVYPLIVLLLPATNRRLRLSVLAAVAAVSIAICIGGKYWHPSVTFYLMPARAWELMFGALAAAFPPLLLKNRLAAESAGYASLALVLSSFFVFDASIGFPNPNVLIPCAAAASLLYFGQQSSATALQLLSIRPLVFTGRVSYSLYLWHLPILMLTQYYAIRPLSGKELTAIWCVIYAVAVTSWVLVENPIRRRVFLPSAREFAVVALAGSLLVGAVGGWFWFGNGLPWRFGRDVQVLSQSDPRPREAEQCMSLPLKRVAAGDLCRIGPERSGVRKFVLWGDSHALALLPAFESLAQSNDVQIYFAGRPNCKPLLDVADGLQPAPNQDCVAFNGAMIAAVQSIHPEGTILSAFWNAENERDPSAFESDREREREREWNSTIGPLRAVRSAVCVVLDVPDLPYPMPYSLAMAQQRNLDTAFIYVSHSDVLLRYRAVEAPIRTLESANALKVVDPKDALCPGERCEIEWEGRSLYRDSNHLSRAGAIRVRDSLAPCFQGNHPKRP